MSGEFINDYYKKSIGSTRKNFANFVKINTPDLTEDDLQDIDYLAHRVAQNMFYFPKNISTAKSDYITLIGMLIKKGVILKEFQNLEPNIDYFEK